MAAMVKLVLNYVTNCVVSAANGNRALHFVHCNFLGIVSRSKVKEKQSNITKCLQTWF